MAIPTRITTILITTTTIPPRRNHSLVWATVVVRATGWEFLPVCPVGQKRKLRDCWWVFFLSVDSSIYVVVVDKGRQENLVVVGRGRKEGKKEWRNGRMERDWILYHYYLLLLLLYTVADTTALLATCYLLLQLPVLCLYAIREFSRWKS